jgi:hypothetical protein
MTLVRIPPVSNGAGDPVPARVRITLVDARSRRALGFRLEDGTFVAEALDLPLGEQPLEVPLLSQSEIALDADGAPTYYRVAILLDGGSTEKQYQVQVEASATPVDLADLVGAASIAPGSLLAGRLLPEGGAIGQVVTRVAEGVAGWGDAGTGSSSVIEHPFAWGDASPATVGLPLAGQTVFRSEIVITEAFDGAGAYLKLGDAGNPQRLIAETEVDPAQVAAFETAPAVAFDGQTAVLLTIVPGGAASAGRGVVRLYL